jgi:GH24 family phage-related lysozyme (muramidase)
MKILLRFRNPMGTSGFARALCLAMFAILGLMAGCAKTFPFIDHLTSGELLEQASGGSRAGLQLRPVYASGLKVTKESEGWVPRLYNDAAKYCTIGYGHLVKLAPCDGTEPDEFRKGLTEQQGEALLVTDMATAQLAVMTSVRVPMTDGQYAALTDFTFNVGGGKLRKSTLLRVVNAGEVEKVPGQLRRWVTAGGKQWPGLVTRREREIILFFDGLPTTRAVPQPGEDLSPIDIRKGE